MNNSHLEPNLLNTVGSEVVQIQHFRWQIVFQMTCEHVCRPGAMHSRCNFPSLFSFNADRTSLIRSVYSVICSYDGAAMIKIVSQYNSISIPEYSRHNITSRRNNRKLSGVWRKSMFPSHTLYFIFRIEIMKPGLVYH